MLPGNTTRHPIGRRGSKNGFTTHCRLRMGDAAMDFVAFGEDVMWRLVAICCAALVVAVSHPVAAQRGILGKDDRRVVPSKYRDLARGIGLIHDLKRRTLCTAFCVGDDVIATNAHCLPYVRIKKRRRVRGVRDFAFYLTEKGAILHHARLQSNPVGDAQKPWMSVLSAGGRASRSWLRENRRDWALAKLTRPICASDVIAFADAKFIRSARHLRKAKAFTIGYHGDKPDQLRRYAPCRIRKISGRGNQYSMNHTCDIFAGASGSPIFAETAEGPRVVALVVGQMWGRRWRQYPSGRKVMISRWKTNVGVLPLELLTKLERFRTAEFATAAMSTRELQLGLIAGGYLRGKADGLFGPQTREAIVNVEKQLGLVPLGIPTKRVISHLAEQ